VHRDQQLSGDGGKPVTLWQRNAISLQAGDFGLADRVANPFGELFLGQIKVLTAFPNEGAEGNGHGEAFRNARSDNRPRGTSPCLKSMCA